MTSSHPRPGLAWGLKNSLVDYVLDSIPDGKVDLSEGCVEAEPRRYFFPAMPAEGTTNPEDGSRILRCSGHLALSGYYGELRVQISHPSVTFGEGVAHLSVTDPEDANARLVVATAALPAEMNSTDLILHPRLAIGALELFLMRYSPGQELSPLQCTLPPDWT